MPASTVALSRGRCKSAQNTDFCVGVSQARLPPTATVWQPRDGTRAAQCSVGHVRGPTLRWEPLSILSAYASAGQTSELRSALKNFEREMR